MKYEPNPRCKNCDALSIAKHTFGMVSAIPEEDQYYFCMASAEDSCLGDESINILKEA